MATEQLLANARKLPKQARSRALVEAVLDATARILVEQGFPATTTNRVAQRAGVSIGSLYQYFPSREALVAAVARRHSERIKASLELELAEGAPDLETGIAALLHAIVQAHRVSPELTAVLGSEVPRLGTLDWKSESTRLGIDLAQRLIDNHADELRPDVDRDAAAFVCCTCVEGVMNAAARQAPERIADGSIRRELHSLLIGYLREHRVPEHGSAC